MEYKPKITLTQDEFRVLASSTRIDIMKLLDESQLTVSDVSRRLNMNKATVHEHLTRLIEVGLVKKEDTDRKWVYYSLTWKGKNLLHPERVKVMVTLATIAIAFVLVGLAFAMRGTDFLGPADDPGTDPDIVTPPTARIVWWDQASDTYDAYGYPTVMHLEFKSSSPALSMGGIKTISTYLEEQPSLTRTDPVALTHAREGNVIHLYDTAGVLHQRGTCYLLLDITVTDTKGNEYKFLLDRLVVPKTKAIDLRLRLDEIRFDLGNLSLSRRVGIAFDVENIGDMDVKGATVHVCSVLDKFTGGGVPTFGSPYLEDLFHTDVDVLANGSVPLSFSVLYSRLYTRKVVVFIDPDSSVPETDSRNNQVEADVPTEVLLMNESPAPKTDQEGAAPGFGAAMAALAALAAVAMAAAARRRVR